jgi:TonB family protein
VQILTVGNLVAQVLQVVLLVAVTATTLTLLRVHSPRVRYAAWRSLLFLVAVVPFVQPWHVTTTIVPAAHAFLQGSVAPPAEPSVFDAATAWGRVHLVPLAIGAGCALRLLWILVGVLRLRCRLRKDGRKCGAATPIQAELHTTAAVYYLEGIQQPATCGWLRPVVLLPAHVETQEAALIRAVLVHELLHVKRGDWPVLVGEELVRALHWFNPVMWWLVDRVQSAREEVVDAAAIPLVGGRRTYVRALLTFADAPPVALAPAFARRRHLFTRITRLSEESTMSTRRAAFTALMLVVCAAAASAAAITTFPISGGEEFLVALEPKPATGQAQDPPPPPAPPKPLRVDLKSRIQPKGTHRATVQGTVNVAVDIAKDGSVTGARVLNTKPDATSPFVKALNEAAIEAAKQWRFAPVPNGPITATYTLTFTLRNALPSPPRKKGRLRD